MRRTPAFLLIASGRSPVHAEPIVNITNGTFYHQHPASNAVSTQNTHSNPALFPKLTFSLPSFSVPPQHWAISSSSSRIRTAFLQILRGQLLCFPPTARTFPYLSSPRTTENYPKTRIPERAIEYVGFDADRKAFGGAYLSARYESLKEDTDFTLGRYLTGIANLNPGEDEIKMKTVSKERISKVLRDLALERFEEKPVSMLSNGQSRRARIGKALLTGPEVLCLDAPFIGLDPIATERISSLLHGLADANAPRIVLSLRPQDVVPAWITHIVYANEDGQVDMVGSKANVLCYLNERRIPLLQSGRLERGSTIWSQTASSMPTLSLDGYEKVDGTRTIIGEPVVEMQGVRIAYGRNTVLGGWQQDIQGLKKDGLYWNVHRGQRWGIFGENGSGKTTLLSLVTSDHPQTYSAPVKLFQRSRLPESGARGITIFEIQSRMGHASPEVHALFPKRLTIRKTLESAWSDTPITKPRLDDTAIERIEAHLRWFEPELHVMPQDTQSPSSPISPSELAWASHTLFGELSFSAQRLLLFLRATIRNPDIVILDEAFSGMDDHTRDKCLLFLSHGQAMELRYTGPCRREPVASEVVQRGEVLVSGLQDHQALLCVSHSRQDVPGCVREWICLPEPGTGPPRFGRFDGPVELNERRWDEVWDRPTGL